MSTKDSLGDRMKGYEGVSRYQLIRRMPVIVRVDGKAFHTFTRGMGKPFDQNMIETMWRTAVGLCKEIQGAKLAYVQSDEISVLLTDYEKIDSQGWFDYGLQKIASVSASIATARFNEVFRVLEPHRAAGGHTALFDARAFNIPKEDVTNYFLWRQQDATRNSIEAVGQAFFSHKALHGVNCDQIQEKLFTEKGINWNDLETYKKRGACAVKVSLPAPPSSTDGAYAQPAFRSKWVIDQDIPIFSQDREYVDRFIFPGRLAPGTVLEGKL